MEMKRANIEMVRALTRGEFIARAIKVHGGRFDYSKVYYKNKHIKICIICQIHGEIWQYPNDHLKGMGYSIC